MSYIKNTFKTERHRKVKNRLGKDIKGKRKIKKKVEVEILISDIIKRK